MQQSHDEVAKVAEAQQVRVFARQYGVVEAARRLGVSKQTMLTIAALLPVRRGSLAVVRAVISRWKKASRGESLEVGS